MMIKLILNFIFILNFSISFSQATKTGTIHVVRNKLAGIYLYESEKGTRTYIKITQDSTVMIANNNADIDYMDYWFDRMGRDSNLPKGKIQLTRDSIYIEIKIAQSKEDNIILVGNRIDQDNLNLKRVGEGYDPNSYIFKKVK